MDEYYCPKCGAILNDQYGFDPNGGIWRCTECGEMLMDEDVYSGDTYEGVAWFCDECGALLNRQSGFSDSLGSWICTECGHVNGTTKEDIINGEMLSCPKCGTTLNNQSCFNKYDDDWECTECGAHLHHNYSDDPYSVVKEKKHICPNCDADLEEQSCYSEFDDDWECTECGAHLHHAYSDEQYEIVDDDYDDGNGYDYERENNEDDSSDGYSCNARTTTSYQGYKSSFEQHDTYSQRELRLKRIKAFFFNGKKIAIGVDYRELAYRDYLFVEKYFRNVGFKNIVTSPVYDLYVESIPSVGDVADISVGGNLCFKAEDEVPYDEKITITYHKKRRIQLPFHLRSLRKMSCSEACSKLHELGFTEIYEHPIYDLVTGWIKKENSVEKVTISGKEDVKKKDEFEYDSKIVVEYHKKKTK